MKKLVKTIIISLVISSAIFALCRYLYFCGNIADYNEGAWFFSVAFMFGISYASLIWAHDCYRRIDKEAGLISWIKETAVFYIYIVVALCLLGMIEVFGRTGSYYFVPVAAGCVLFPCFYIAVYYLTVRLSGNCRMGLTVGIVFCTMEFIQINFIGMFTDTAGYDICNLFSGFTKLYYYESFVWIFEILAITVLLYIAAAAVMKKGIWIKK